MNERLTRQNAIAKGLPTCYGSPCKKHPELEGLRRVSGACVQCAKETLVKCRKNNPEKLREWTKTQYVKQRQNPEFVVKKRELDRQYQKQNREKMSLRVKEWMTAHPEKAKEYAAAHRQRHPGAKNADTAKRRAAKLLRTPKWLSSDDLWVIQEAYKLAALRTKMFGFVWHVDHIIPLQGALVSGLHVPENLQVIPWIDNIRKGNSLVEGVA
jgi:hypothetical protein